MILGLMVFILVVSLVFVLFGVMMLMLEEILRIGFIGFRFRRFIEMFLKGVICVSGVL